MDKAMITAPSAPPTGPYSPGLAVGDWVFLAGQTGAGDTIEEQTEQALDKVVALLEEAGCTVADVVSCLVHLADLSTFQRHNVVYERYFPEPRPVRTTVGASLLGGAMVEVTVVARRPGCRPPARTAWRWDRAATAVARSTIIASATRTQGEGLLPAALSSAIP
jgi:2-iminobutanoate/2-iminopropanoate deaminase